MDILDMRNLLVSTCHEPPKGSSGLSLVQGTRSPWLSDGLAAWIPICVNVKFELESFARYLSTGQRERDRVNAGTPADDPVAAAAISHGSTRLLDECGTGSFRHAWQPTARRVFDETGNLALGRRLDRPEHDATRKSHHDSEGNRSHRFLPRVVNGPSEPGFELI
jgi:hypothetical protein